jgi:trimethylamine--corrinoid protein Co-methyltransferase
LTPFKVKALDVEVILQACRWGAPVHACSLPTLGGTAPITPVGTVILAGIEVLSLLLIAQTIRPGTPVLGLATSLAMDMHSGMALKANVEAMRTNAASAQFISKAYGIPTHICGMTTDTFISDGQSQIERCLGGLNLAQSGVDIMGRAGELEAAKIISPAQLVVDNELVAMIKHLLSPLQVNAQTMAWEDLLAVAPGGHFLQQPSTVRYCRDVFRSTLFKHQAREVWESKGGKDSIERARQKALDVWTSQADTKWLDQDTRTELDRIVSRADRSLAA